MNMPQTKQPIVSIVVPVFNIAKFLDTCLSSLLSQGLHDFEIICVNDGSTDSSASIIESHQSKHPCIQCIHIRNSGLSVARNEGLAKANGKYVYFIDGDDHLEAHSLAKVIDLAESHEADAVFFNASTFFETKDLEKINEGMVHAGERNQLYGGIFTGAELGLKFLKNHEYTPSVPMALYKKEFIESCGLNFIPNIIHEDNLFTFNVFLLAKKCIHISKPFYKRLIRGGSITNSLAAAKSFMGYAVSHFEMINTQHPLLEPLQLEFSRSVITNVYVHCMKILESPKHVAAVWPLVLAWHHPAQRLHMEALLFSAEKINSAYLLGMNDATQGLLPSPGAQGRATVPTLGHVDEVLCNPPNHDQPGHTLTVTGWMLLWHQHVPDALTLLHDSKVYSAHAVKWTSRPDVLEHHQHATLTCGFTARFMVDKPIESGFAITGLLGRAVQSEAIAYSK